MNKCICQYGAVHTTICFIYLLIDQDKQHVLSTYV